MSSFLRKSLAVAGLSTLSAVCFAVPPDAISDLQGIQKLSQADINLMAANCAGGIPTLTLGNSVYINGCTFSYGTSPNFARASRFADILGSTAFASNAFAIWKIPATSNASEGIIRVKNTSSNTSAVSCLRIYSSVASQPGYPLSDPMNTIINLDFNELVKSISAGSNRPFPWSAGRGIYRELSLLISTPPGYYICTHFQDGGGGIAASVSATSLQARLE